MPKIRNHRGTKKRFRVTPTGKVMRRHASQSHILEKKSQKRKRLFAGGRQCRMPICADPSQRPYL